MRYVSVQLVHDDIIIANIGSVVLYRQSTTLPPESPDDEKVWRAVEWSTPDDDMADLLFDLKSRKQNVEVVISTFEDTRPVNRMALPFEARNLGHSWSCCSDAEKTWHFSLSGFLDRKTLIPLESE